MFFFNDTATTEIYTLSLHDALPIFSYNRTRVLVDTTPELRLQCIANDVHRIDAVVYTHAHADHVMGLDDVRRFNAVKERSEEHTSELQSRQYLVCRLLLEKKNNRQY